MCVAYSRLLVVTINFAQLKLPVFESKNSPPPDSRELQFFLQLFVSLRDNLHETLPSGTSPEMTMYCNVFVAVSTAKDRSYLDSALCNACCNKNSEKLHFKVSLCSFMFITDQGQIVVQLVSQQKQEKLPSVTAPLVTNNILDTIVSQDNFYTCSSIQEKSEKCHCLPCGITKAPTTSLSA